MNTQLRTSRSRRQMLTAAVGGLAGLVAAAAQRPSRTSAATGDNFVLGTNNTANAVTRLTTVDPVTGGKGMELLSPSSLTGLNVEGGTTGVAATGNVTAIQGTSTTDAMSVGVRGTSTDGVGIAGDSQVAGVIGSGYFGVYGLGAIGTIGDTDGGTGLQGWSGAAFPPNPTPNTGVWAGAEAGRTALQVFGRAKFSRSGRTSFSAGNSQKSVTVPGGVSSNSFALAVLNNSRAGIWVRAVVPNPSTDRITIYLNKPVSSVTQCAWIVLS
jgi:hypothetical protein